MRTKSKGMMHHNSKYVIGKMIDLWAYMDSNSSRWIWLAVEVSDPTLTCHSDPIYVWNIESIAYHKVEYHPSRWRHQMETFSVRVTDPLCEQFTGYRWIHLTKASDAELWCFLWSAPRINGWINNREQWVNCTLSSVRSCCIHLSVVREMLKPSIIIIRF